MHVCMCGGGCACVRGEGVHVCMCACVSSSVHSKILPACQSTRTTLS